MQKEVHILIDEVNEELVKILQYWINNRLDNEYGGFYGKINHFNQVVSRAPKGAVLNSRILWTFVAAYNKFNTKRFLEIATRAFNHLKNYFYDEQNGGLYWGVDYRGELSITRKQIYAQGFGIYGFSEYYKASGNEES